MAIKVSNGVAAGVAVGGSYSQSKINADHASVNEQAGIYAGDDGYDVNVKKHTDLKGAIITSTQQAEEEGKNHFSAGSLTHSDIENHSSYKGSSFGVSGSVVANFDTPFGENGKPQSSKQATNKDGMPIYIDSNGNETVNATGADGKANSAKPATGWASVQPDYGMGYGSDSESQSSVTKSGINTKNIEIRNEAEQLARTGKTEQETIEAVKTDITTDNAESQSGKLTNTFDKDKVQKELDLQREVTEEFGKTVTQTGAMIAEKLSEAVRNKKYEAAVELENAQKARAENDTESNRTLEAKAQAKFNDAINDAKEWETGGKHRRTIDSALNVLSTALAGRPVAEVVASGLSPTVNHQIKEATKDRDDAVNLTAHALWGAVEAYAGNRNVAAGAAGAVTGEVAAKIIANTLYNKAPNELTQEEKLTVSTLSQAAAGIAGGTLADNHDGAIIAAKTAKDAVENNFEAHEHPTIVRQQYIDIYAKTIFKGDVDKATDYVDGFDEGKSQGYIDNAKDTVEMVLHPIDTAKSLWDVVTNPTETYDNVVISAKEWEQIFDYAINNDPKLAGQMQGYLTGKFSGVIPSSGVTLVGGGVALTKSFIGLKKAGHLAIDFTKNQVNRVVNHTVLNRVINEVDNVAVSTDKGFINATKVCAASCEIKATSKAEQNLIDDIVKNGDIKGSKTEALINDLAKRSGYEPLKGGKYGANNGFDHVLVGKDGSVIIIDSKQIKNNGTIQVSSKGAGDTNQLSSKWINVVSGKLSKNDPVRIAIENAELQEKPIKTIIAGVDKSNGKVVLLPVKVPNKH